MGRLRAGEWLAGLGGLGLLAVLFADWYGVAGRDATTAGGTGWQVFAVLDVLLVALALLGIAVAVTCATRRSPAVPVAAAVLATGFGIVMTLLVLYRLANQPGPNDLVDVRLGAWLGLLATLAVAVGGWRTLADERLEAAEPPHVPARPAPPASAPEGSLVATGGVPEAEPPAGA
jgi:hypothetical protein